jgi:hypothetical protein
MEMILGTAFAVRSTFLTFSKVPPEQLVLGKDMIFNVQHTSMK